MLVEYKVKCIEDIEPYKLDIFLNENAKEGWMLVFMNDRFAIMAKIIEDK